MKEKKTFKITMENAEGKMKLNMTGTTAAALKIMKTFDEACEEMRKKELETER